LDLAEKLDKQEKKRLRKEEKKAVKDYKELLQEKVPLPNTPYKEAKRDLEGDPRWAKLADEQRLELFKEHQKATFETKKKEFRELLEEVKVNPHSEWESILEQIQEDRRFLDFPERSRKPTFEGQKQFIERKIKREFQQMMQETATRMLVSKYTKEQNAEEQLTELLEDKDSRFKTMGLYFEGERQEALRDEIRALTL